MQGSTDEQKGAMQHLIFEKKNRILLLTVLLVALSWAGISDKYSNEYLNSSIVEAGTVYAIARGINGLVSVLQTSTIQAGLGIRGSVAVGEILDPINDLIERFSQVMTLVLSSLVLQKILLVAAAHGVFKVLLTLFGALSVVFLWLGKARATSVAWRVFLILIFVRFSLVIPVSMNSIADNMFLSGQIAAGTKNLDELKSDVSRLEQSSEEKAEDFPLLEAEIDDIRARHQEIKKTTLPSLRSKLDNVDIKYRKVKADLEELYEKEGWRRYNPLSKDNDDVVKVKNKLSDLENQREKLENDIKKNENRLEELDSDITAIQNTLEGKANNIGEIFKRWLTSIDSVLPSFDAEKIRAMVTGSVENIIKLLVLFLLKTVFIPLIFLYCFIRGAKFIWKIDWWPTSQTDVRTELA